MFAREGPKIRAKDLLNIPLVPPSETPPPDRDRTVEDEGSVKEV